MKLDASETSSTAHVFQLLHDTDHDPHARAAVAILGTTGRFASELELDQLARWIDMNAGAQALAFLSKRVKATPQRVLRRRLSVTDGVITDLTRMSSIPDLTGIPRVVSSVIALRGPNHGHVAVWASGAPGLASYLSTVRHSESREPVETPSARERIRQHLRAGYGSATRFANRHSQLSPLVAAMSGPAATASRLMMHTHGPQDVILPGKAVYFLPEVAFPEVTTRVLAWRRVADRFRLVMWVHDLLPLTHAEFFARQPREDFLIYFRMLAQADLILVASDHMVPLVNGACELLGGRPPTVKVIPFGTDLASAGDSPLPGHQQVAVRHGNEALEFVMVGTVEPRKNHSSALQAASLVVSEGSPVRIHVIGKEKPWSEELSASVRHANEVGVDIVFHGALPDEQMIRLLERCDASLYLSTAEGYGLPIVESRALGVPVIASNIAPHRLHATGGGVQLVNPGVPSEVASAMLNVRRYSRNRTGALPVARSWEAFSTDVAAELDGILSEISD